MPAASCSTTRWTCCCPIPENQRRLEQNPYPEGFAGSTMQFLAYQARGVGGFLLGTEDAGRALKWFDVAGDGEHLRMSVSHKTPVLRAGASFVPAYPVVIAALDGGAWTDAADRYRSWALHQPWAQVGPTGRLAARGGRHLHLRRVGAARPKRLAAGGEPRCRDVPSSTSWVPTGRPRATTTAATSRAVDRTGSRPSFHPANLATIAEHGGRWAPFEFDLLERTRPGRRRAGARIADAPSRGSVGPHRSRHHALPVHVPRHGLLA